MKTDRPQIIHTYPVGKGHVTNGQTCWCEPKTIVYPNGAKQIIHNDIASC